MISEKRNKRISKFLSLVLRHEPEKIGLDLDEAGWANVKELIRKCNTRDFKLTNEILEEVVRTNAKKRFALSEDGQKIRANQGHTFDISHGYEPKQAPRTLYHGSATKNMTSILAEGIDKRLRHHVHLSEDLSTAIAVGKRHGTPVVFVIDSATMMDECYLFYQSDNNVWLTESVPAKYLRVLDSTNSEE